MPPVNQTIQGGKINVSNVPKIARYLSHPFYLINFLLRLHESWVTDGTKVNANDKNQEN